MYESEWGLPLVKMVVVVEEEEEEEGIKSQTNAILSHLLTIAYKPIDSLSVSVHPSVCLSVCPQRVIWKCYFVVNVLLLLLLL